MAATLTTQDSATDKILYLALELSDKKWLLGFSNGERQRKKSITAGDLEALDQEVTRAKEKLKLAPECSVRSCYEAGRDGFWIHRVLLDRGIDNRVVDSASIEVNRRKRRAKSDPLDVDSLLRQLMREAHGERRVWQVCRVPSPEEEDRRRLSRERERMMQERTAHTNRLSSLLVLHGIRLVSLRNLPAQLPALRGADGRPLGEILQQELRRESLLYCLVCEQINHIEAERHAFRKQASADEASCYGSIKRLMQLRGVGIQSSWILVMEALAWRDFRNRRQVGAAAGLTPSPYSSGDSEREQGISKAGNRRLRTTLVELSWLWLRYQPDSALSRWFNERYARQGKRLRRIGIVALARRLWIALWRYETQGIVPEGAVVTATA